MSELGPDGDALLAAIASRALERNQERADRLVTLLAAGADPLADAVREDATTLAHQIAGSAGTFGYEAASALARTVMDGLAAGGAAATVRPAALRVVELLTLGPDSTEDDDTPTPGAT
ncbi:Hpt domain-containing protein [Litorihabitans aurantiacus]|uniref:HPt domain-containing protein n=1 Tax=Litorihabitans aurantiacus TaxID=1930061 RepID=A0AA37XIK0_9MICO|nr:Hpt domain-containing protein [Litorihabitans aurantiacus]GMA33471.1 hypothetical protein GCM10025875_34630 [Litorihabitans aurantiacus]